MACKHLIKYVLSSSHRLHKRDRFTAEGVVRRHFSSSEAWVSATVGLVKKAALMWKRLKWSILYGGYLLLVTLLLLEIGVRVLGYSEHYIYDPIYRLFEQNDAIPYIHKPNLLQARARGLTVINTDSLGLRVKTSGAVYGAKQPHEYRIAIAGDSVTFGEGIPHVEDTYSQVLEDSFDQQPNMTVKVFNFGVSAYSVKQMAATLQYRMLDLQPDLVVMAIIPADFDLARTPIIDKEGYLIDQTVASFPIPSLVTNILRKVHMVYVFKKISLRWIFQPAQITPLLVRGEIPDSYRYIEQFKETAERNGKAYLIVLLPSMEDDAWGALPDLLAQSAITYLDLSPLRKEFTKEEYMASRLDPHASPKVHHRIGESLAGYIRTQMGLLP